MRPGKVKRSIGSKGRQVGLYAARLLRGTKPMDLPAMQATMIPIANTNHFMIVDELSAALASRPGYGSGEAGAPAIAAPGQQDYMERTSVPSQIAVTNRRRSSCFRSRT